MQWTCVDEGDELIMQFREVQNKRSYNFYLNGVKLKLQKFYYLMRRTWSKNI